MHTEDSCWATGTGIWAAVWAECYGEDDDDAALPAGRWKD